MKNLSHLVLMLAALSLNIACSGGGSNSNPEIVTLSPAIGEPGSVVVVSIKNFDNTKDQMTFSGVPLNLSLTHTTAHLSPKPVEELSEEENTTDTNQVSYRFIVPNFTAGVAYVRLSRDATEMDMKTFQVIDAIGQDEQETEKEDSPENDSDKPDDTPELPQQSLVNIEVTGKDYLMYNDSESKFVDVSFSVKNVQSAYLMAPTYAAYNKPVYDPIPTDISGHDQFAGDSQYPFLDKDDELDIFNSYDLLESMSFAFGPARNKNTMVPLNYCFIPRANHMDNRRVRLHYARSNSLCMQNTSGGYYNYVNIMIPLKDGEANGRLRLHRGYDQSAYQIYYIDWENRLRVKSVVHGKI